MFEALLRILEGSGLDDGSGSRHARRVRKPAGLIYGTGDAPPSATTAVLGLQHAMESVSKVAVPVVLLAALGAAGNQLETMIVVTLIVSGIATILVSSRLRMVGRGHLLPAAIFSSFAAPAILAASVGGLRLLAGMTRVLPRWRFLFPPEVVGLIAFMVGASQASLAVTRFLGMDRLDQPPRMRHIAIASGSLGLLAVLTVWGKGKLRLFSTLITLVGGYPVSLAAGAVKPELWKRVLAAPFLVLGLISAL